MEWLEGMLLRRRVHVPPAEEAFYLCHVFREIQVQIHLPNLVVVRTSKTFNNQYMMNHTKKVI